MWIMLNFEAKFLTVKLCLFTLEPGLFETFGLSFFKEENDVIHPDDRNSIKMAIVDLVTFKHKRSFLRLNIHQVLRALKLTTLGIRIPDLLFVIFVYSGGSNTEQVWYSDGPLLFG